MSKHASRQCLPCPTGEYRPRTSLKVRVSRVMGADCSCCACRALQVCALGLFGVRLCSVRPTPPRFGTICGGFVREPAVLSFAHPRVKYSCSAVQILRSCLFPAAWHPFAASVFRENLSPHVCLRVFHVLKCASRGTAVVPSAVQPPEAAPGGRVREGRRLKPSEHREHAAHREFLVVLVVVRGGGRRGARHVLRKEGRRGGAEGRVSRVVRVSALVQNCSCGVGVIVRFRVGV